MNEHVRESLKHWFRMRRWVRLYKRRHSVQIPNVIVMENSIDECWSAINCALCIKYQDDDYTCRCCPLYLNGDCCHDYGSAWRAVPDSETWTDWLKASNKMIKALWEVRDYGE